VEILSLLENLNCIKEYKIIDYKKFTDGFYYKIQIFFTDESILFAKEYFDLEERNYSFHWQKNDNSLIKRWDNAPHHKNIATFPHHKHCKDGIHESFEISLVEVLKKISQHFS